MPESTKKIFPFLKPQYDKNILPNRKTTEINIPKFFILQLAPFSLLNYVTQRLEMLYFSLLYYDQTRETLCFKKHR